MSMIRIRALAFQDSGYWCVQCLEYDIAAQAETIPELRRELARVLLSHVTLSKEYKKEPFAGLPQAPKWFFEMYNSLAPTREEEEGTLLDSSPPIVPLLRFAHSHSR